MLTDIACRKAKGKDKPYKLSDSGGLYLEVMPSGFRSWRWKYRFGGKEKRLVFGPYPDVTLTQARDLRADAARTLRDGIDPGVDKRQRSAALTASAAVTFQVIAMQWYESQEKLWSPRYAAIVKRSLELDVFPRLGPLPIDAISTPIVLEVLRQIEARGAIETAHRVRQRISEVFARAIGSGLATSDPAAITRTALGKVKKSKSSAVRTITEARKVLQKVEASPAHPMTKLASRMLALTGVRSAVVRLAEPHEFEGLDGPEPIWRIPAAKMKLAVERKEDAAFEFIVPLSRQAVHVVRVALDLAGTAPLVFRSVRHPRKPMSDSTISKLYRDAGLSRVHVPHGWRSTFSTIMNERITASGDVAEVMALDRAIIDLMLAHIQGGVEAAYNRAAYMPRRRKIAQEWADMLTKGLAHPAVLLTGKRQS